MRHMIMLLFSIMLMPHIPDYNIYGITDGVSLFSSDYYIVPQTATQKSNATHPYTYLLLATTSYNNSAVEVRKDHHSK